MSNARNLARLIVDSGGDVDVSSLGNVPPSNDASALTTGTLPVGRLPSSGVSASSLTAGTLGTERLPSTGGTVIKTSTYRYTGQWQAPSTTTPDYVWWNVTFNRTRSDSSLWIVSDQPVYELTNGVWIGVAMDVNGFSHSRGLKHFRPNTDTTCIGFNCVVTAAEIGSTTGNISIKHKWNWGWVSGANQPFNWINFSGGGANGASDARISSSKKTEGFMIVQEIV